METITKFFYSKQRNSVTYRQARSGKKAGIVAANIK